ncbi:uncharacterized protein PGTG_03673 [Puccinia graminis f. sp. tritici CRL 75-36-700-3]|uniref:Uncharacterized protein n=1 Tax=Puccinia graminis f. sp. tritici (strain CRL 75-36-700-3 / race SCCL) TaxID=418459 RepID=E3K092_PUCGT|nr:uncharacterized protein PGTG_03673 [Puccinia graminis f. sp. tritici CRL 75-36-700-3]EFP77717.1 hypothetical protein PGTG_03673 [Puccinia graminis f. sp. tritici CRL 75-36-700-3]
MAHDSAVKKVASWVHPELAPNGSSTGKARVPSQKPFSSTAEKKPRLSEHPKPQYSAHSESSDTGEINVNVTDVTKAGLEKKELFYRRIIAPLFPALLDGFLRLD